MSSEICLSHAYQILLHHDSRFLPTIIRRQANVNGEFTCPDTIISTNIGIDRELANSLLERRIWGYLQPKTLIETFHKQEDNLVHRVVKDFGMRRTILDIAARIVHTLKTT